MQNIQQVISKIVSSGSSGKIGIAAKNLSTKKILFLNENAIFGTASVIKLAIAIALFYKSQRKKISMQNLITIKSHKNFNNKGRDAGILKSLSNEFMLPLEILCTMMVSVSDNTATNYILKVIDYEEVNYLIRELGFPNTKVNVGRIDHFLMEDSTKDLGETTPKEFLKLLENTVTHKILDKEHANRLLGMMSVAPPSHKIDHYLPLPLYYWEPKNRIIYYGSKSGDFPRLKSNTDVAVIKTQDNQTLVICIFTSGVVDKNKYLRHSSPEHISTKIIAKLGFEIYKYLTSNIK